MEQLLHAFGIDIKLITVQIINFVVLAVILSYLLYKPVLRLLNERQAKIKQGLVDAEKAAKDRETAKEKRQAILTEAAKEASVISENAKADAEAKATAKESEAKAQAEKIVQRAEARATEIAEQARLDSEAEVAKLAVLAAEKILRAK